ncbi:hypothetical protein [Azospirillum griseum]|uniref:Uncharacterized protein n=1 Tax=Azospirillum griseum TaxID=2496639 RepID=A0A431VKV7_9PROT|nr:hypothetical protein [Azospirillum griseum]RTR21409.1 hypothetical protein EJ903_08330 [Azospirillum griseum]
MEQEYIDIDYFESSKLLIERAKKRNSEFHLHCQEFLRKLSHDVIRIIDGKSGDFVIKFRFHQRIPKDLYLDASEIISLFREALDHSICDSIRFLGKSPGHAAFPIGDAHDTYEKSIKSKCKNVHPDILSLIRETKAYRGGNDFLYEICERNNKKKHNRILSLSANQIGFLIDFSKTNIEIPHTALRDVPINKWCETRNELEIFRCGPGARGSIDFIPNLDIRIRDSGPHLSGSAHVVFEKFSQEVEKIVFDIEKETKRISEINESNDPQ